MDSRQVGTDADQQGVVARSGEAQQVAVAAQVGDAQQFLLDQAARRLRGDGVQEELVHPRDPAGPRPASGRAARPRPALTG